MSRLFAASQSLWNPLPTGPPVQSCMCPPCPIDGVKYSPACPLSRPNTSSAASFRSIPALGPSLFFFALYFTGRRRWAIAAALAYSFLSPSYGLFRRSRRTRHRATSGVPGAGQVRRGSAQHRAHPVPLALLALSCRKTPRLSDSAGGSAAGRDSLTNCGGFALAISRLPLLLAAWGEPPRRGARSPPPPRRLLACFWPLPVSSKSSSTGLDSFAYQLGNQQAVRSPDGGGALWCALFRFSADRSIPPDHALRVWLISTVYYIYASTRFPNRAAMPSSSSFSSRWRWQPSAGRQHHQTFRLCAYASGGLLLAGLLQLFNEAAQGGAAGSCRAGNHHRYQLATGRAALAGGPRLRLRWTPLCSTGSISSAGGRRLETDL